MFLKTAVAAAGTAMDHSGRGKEVTHVLNYCFINGLGDLDGFYLVQKTCMSVYCQSGKSHEF